MAKFWATKMFWCPFCEKEWGPLVKEDVLTMVRTCGKHRG